MDLSEILELPAKKKLLFKGEEKAVLKSLNGKDQGRKSQKVTLPKTVKYNMY